MDDSHDHEARTPQINRPVTEQEMLATLNRALWEVERQRAQEAEGEG